MQAIRSLVPLATNTSEIKEYLKGFKSRELVPFACPNCNDEFTKAKNVVQRRFSERGDARRLFCSLECQANGKRKIVKVECANCGVEVIRAPHDRKKTKSGRYFCGFACAATFNMKLRCKGKRSKAEILLYEFLSKEFPALRIVPNDKSLLGGYEADIAIPELKLAIEWNGILHFRPIYGHERLNEIQERDALKRKIAIERNVQLLVIPDMISRPKFVERIASEVIQIIRQLSEKQLGNLISG